MLNKVVEIISDKLSLDANTITSESKIIEDLGADSLDIVELVMALEDEVGIEIPTDEILTFVTVGDVVQYLESI